MRRISQLTAICLGAAAVYACSPDRVIPTEAIPTGGVRFINALPDSAGAGGLDFRFVDIVESNAHFKIPFRNNPVASGGVTASTLIEYKNTQAGSRHYRVFLNDTTAAGASTVLFDGNIQVDAGKNYTVLVWGFARTGQTPAAKLTIIDESTITDPGTAVALRVINATNAAIDVRHYLAGGTAPAAATWGNVAALTASSFVTVPVGTYMYNVRAAGGATALFTDMQALVGAAKTVDIGALPGTSVGGSAVTLLVFPRSVAGSKAPQAAAFQVTAGSFMWDRRPN